MENAKIGLAEIAKKIRTKPSDSMELWKAKHVMPPQKWEEALPLTSFQRCLSKFLFTNNFNSEPSPHKTLLLSAMAANRLWCLVLVCLHAHAGKSGQSRSEHLLIRIIIGCTVTLVAPPQWRQQQTMSYWLAQAVLISHTTQFWHCLSPGLLGAVTRAPGGWPEWPAANAATSKT